MVRLNDSSFDIDIPCRRIRYNVASLPPAVFGSAHIGSAYPVLIVRYFREISWKIFENYLFLF